ncbi:hypothetical protein [Streptomyces sp. NPDC006193]|uniref:hypothetical protein n=1 Tax=Streptomyces sp. NPDC006193 TaxID=3155717 RepID=UPI0033B2F540
MTAVRTTTLLGVAAEAALAVPGVAGLQPRLARRLAAAAAPDRADAPPPDTSPQAGVRADRAPDGAGWRIEVRCVLAGGRRVPDVARDVHDRVEAAVTARLTALGAAERVSVVVTVTRIADRSDGGAPGR